ncbi:alpha/beta fold hydrolase [Tianweitania sp. BSSL-BM11]|uniref:Alpha/beta fold hydrolase n=1 Tax=Tianweitania aestuarii TaxID=2814886 RepID=A0ABS5RU47_9HYPH|nr:alpha/beta fold hydrolase [Tianweitania aestuarii]MBS9720578.1 alpha/beta fold hydrolase [Tianweitania aestuarii]
MPVLTLVLICGGVLVAAVVGIILWGWLSTRRIAAQAERMVPPLGKFIEINGSRIHYYEVGEGEPIVMIHGLGGHYHQFRQPLMEAIGPGYRMIALDREGSGHSTRADGRTGRLPEQAALIKAFIDAMKLDRPMLVGHSLGGAVALQTAVDYPESVSGVALLSPLTQMMDALNPEFRRLYLPSPLIRRFLSHTFAVPLALRNGDRVMRFVFGPNTPPEDFAIEGGGMLSLRPGHFYATASDLVAIPLDLAQLQARYGSLKMPVGVLYGRGDQVLDYRIHGERMLDQVPNLDLELIDGVGHMPQYAETNRVAAFIRRIAERAFAVDRSVAVG